MKIRVGQIPYLNSEPFYHGLDIPDIDLCPMPPRAMGELAKAGELEAGPFSLVHCFELDGQFEPLGEMGISVKGQVNSVILLSRAPIGELSGATIGITSETATAVNLLKVLLEQRYSLRPPEYAGLDSSYLDAFLLIGDKALARRSKVARFPYRIDLAAEWLDWQGLPFVFALWMVRRSLEPHRKQWLASTLRGRLADNLAHNLGAIAAKRRELGMTAKEVAVYLRRFRFVLDEEDWRAVEVFKKAWQSLPVTMEALA